MLLLIAEGPRHAATAGGYDVELAIGKQSKHGDGLFNAHQRLLVTVAVKPYLHRDTSELLGSDIPLGHFTHDEFVVEEAVLRQPFGVGPHVFWNQVRVFVAEREYATGFDAHQGSVIGDDVAQQLDVLLGIAGCKTQTPFGDGGASAFDSLRDDHLIAEGGEQLRESQAKGGFLHVGELVGEEVYFAACGGCW